MTTHEPDTPDAPARRPRLLQLDILRGVAVLLVIGRHPIMNPAAAGAFRPLAETWFRFGWTGVDLFFVLSGFLIGGLLFNELHTRGRLDVGRFLVRRGFKIWPSYYLYLAFLVGLGAWRGIGASTMVRDLWPNLLNVQNYFGTPRDHTWSLAVEEHFYLALPLLLLVLPRRMRGGRVVAIPGVPAFALLSVLLCTAWRCLDNLGRPYTVWMHMFPTHLRIDSLFFGVLLGYWYHFYPERLGRVGRFRAVLLTLGFVLVAPMLVRGTSDPLVTTVGFTALYLGYGCILLAFIFAPADRGLSGWLLGGWLGRAIAWVGLYSYSIYLWHVDLALYPVLWLIRGGHVSSPPRQWVWPVAMGLFVALSIASGAVMGALIERPALALRDWLFPPRADALSGSKATPARVQ